MLHTEHWLWIVVLNILLFLYNKTKEGCINGFSKFYVYWVGRKYGGVVLSSCFVFLLMVLFGVYNIQPHNMYRTKVRCSLHYMLHRC